jgi:hypothetical protein
MTEAFFLVHLVNVHQLLSFHQQLTMMQTPEVA